MTGAKFRTAEVIEQSRQYPQFMDGREACKAHPPEVFFPEKAAGIAKAQRVCRRCPLVEPCARWAVDTNQPDGVWGATTPRQRHQIKRRNGGRR